MAKTKNSQKVIEAEANLQTAKMLEALKNLQESMREFDDAVQQDYGQSVESAVDEIFEPLEALKKLMVARKRAMENCEIKDDLALVNNIVKGIQLKAQYEMEIEELKTKLKVANKVNKEKDAKITAMKQQFIKILENVVNLDDRETKVLVKNFLEMFSTNTMEDAIKRGVDTYIEQELLKDECESDQPPF